MVNGIPPRNKKGRTVQRINLRQLGRLHAEDPPLSVPSSQKVRLYRAIIMLRIFNFHYCIATQIFVKLAGRILGHRQDGLKLAQAKRKL
jgi:hypothetical protein